MWEELAVNALVFYRNMDDNLQELDTRLQEIEEEYIVFPHTYYDEDLGQVFVNSGNIEDTVIWKIEAEESLLKAKERIVERCDRIARAISSLSVEEQLILNFVYLDDSYKPFSPFNPRKVKEALLKFYRFIVQEKAVIRGDKEAARKQQLMSNLEDYLRGGGR